MLAAPLLAVLEVVLEILRQESRPPGQVAGRQFAAGDQVENGTLRNAEDARHVCGGVQGLVG